MGQALAGISFWLGWALLALASAGTLYSLAAAVVVWRFFGRIAPPGRHGEAVTILKPLHGAEPRLRENLASFRAQDYDGAVEIVCGVASVDDRAVAAVESARLVTDGTRHGANAKVSNLINMARSGPLAPIVVLSDSDIVVGPDYLARLVEALAQPGVGAVSCLYRGRGDAGFWSRLAAGWPSYQFLPGAVFAVAFGVATPCMGSTIAFRRETLERIGGFEAFADVLADDHAIGRAVEGLGLRVAIPPMLVVHASDEASFGALWRHELRWAVTVKGITPGAYAASVIGFPFALALLGAVLAREGWSVVVAVLAARLAVSLVVDRVSRARTMPLWLLPIRDVLSFAVFVASFFARSVDWRGARLRMAEGGRIRAASETPR